MIRLSIFDDNPILLDGLRLLLQESEEIFLAGSYHTAVYAVSDIKTDRPDVVLMDIQLPGVSGIEAVRKIKLVFPEVPILMQTVFDDTEKVFAAICAGASGYILKTTSSAKLLDAIKEVYAGGSPMSPPIARKVLQVFQQQFAHVQSDYQALTPREHQILSCLVKGHSYKLIADVCQITYNTVHSHIKKIYEKLHVNSASEAVAKALKQRIIGEME